MTEPAEGVTNFAPSKRCHFEQSEKSSLNCTKISRFARNDSALRTATLLGQFFHLPDDLIEDIERLMHRLWCCHIDAGAAQ
jgi:hypothetical protein